MKGAALHSLPVNSQASAIQISKVGTIKTVTTEDSTADSSNIITREVSSSETNSKAIILLL